MSVEEFDHIHRAALMSIHEEADITSHALEGPTQVYTRIEGLEEAWI